MSLNRAGHKQGQATPSLPGGAGKHCEASSSCNAQASDGMGPMVCPQQHPLRTTCSLSNLRTPKSPAPTGHRQGRVPRTSGRMSQAITDPWTVNSSTVGGVGETL